LLPSFLIKRIPKGENLKKIRKLLDPSIHTVCESAKCPNLGECFSKSTLTFMVLGNVCTRNCAFCGIEKGKPEEIDLDEPQKIANAAEALGLKFVVVTSVTRDDLEDGGANHFSKVIRALNDKGLQVEVLIPDFKGSHSSLDIVINANPRVINHNIETVPSLYSKIRPMADYQRSLKVLKYVKEREKNIYTKSGFMVGLGEREQEVFDVLKDLREVGTDFVTIGQYLPPSRNHLKPQRYVPPEEFDRYKEFGESLGIAKVFSGPFVRSSYQAEELIGVEVPRHQGT